MRKDLRCERLTWGARSPLMQRCENRARFVVWTDGQSLETAKHVCGSHVRMYNLDRMCCVELPQSRPLPRGDGKGWG